jgi:hypothetical protein
LETLVWDEGDVPPLDVKPGWHRQKMSIQETGALYRMSLLYLKVVRNSSTKLVRVEFEYEVELFDDYENKWTYA